MKVFTTGQVAKICKVAPRTVSKWFDSGRLKGYRIPGSMDRRIPREYLIKFLKEHGMPLGTLEDDDKAKVLLVSKDPVFVGNAQKEMTPERAFKVTVADTSFDAGLKAESFKPDAVVVDLSLGNEGLEAIKNLRSNPEYAELTIVAILPESGTSQLERSQINETFRKPFDAKLLVERLWSLIGARKELAA